MGFGFCFKPLFCCCNPCCPPPITPCPAGPALVYASSGAQSVATGTIIPVVATAPANSGLTITNGQIALPAGTYQVNYGFSGSIATVGDITVALYSNNAALSGETATTYAGVATQNYGASRSSIITLATSGTISLYNTSASTVAFTNAYINVTQLMPGSNC